jgi:hypothetical protein
MNFLAAHVYAHDMAKWGNEEKVIYTYDDSAWGNA